MQIQIDDLVQGRFKKEIAFDVPQDSVDKTGATNYEKLRFIGQYINVPDEERDNHQKKLAELQAEASKLAEDSEAGFDEENAVKKEILELTHSFIKKYFVGFEKHPRYPFPFLVGDRELPSNEDGIDALLKIRRVREAISDTYHEEINKNQNKKLNKMLSGNLPR